ncbi:MAG: hypothetical protein LBK99_04040 [Opitutaceae bacterium]|jgi:hypothetical protein|nr:hypothetical protein [Opitutaceae bacterium]
MNTHKKTKTTAALSAALLAAAITLVPFARASILTTSDGAASDHVGESVSSSGNNALVGAFGDDDKGNSSGSAYYYKGLDSVSGKVSQRVKLVASDGAADDEFGRSVSLSGDNALIAARYDDDTGSNSGSAYYYKALNSKSGTVTQNVKLVASDSAAGDEFGHSVSLSGNNALIGAQNDDDKSTESGSAYYYKALDSASGTVTESVKLLASDGEYNDRFGYSVSLSADNALAGALQDDDKANSSGSAYYYKALNNVSGNSTGIGTLNGKNATYETVKLLASDGAATDLFGGSVSLEGDNALVGAYYKGSGTGSAYYYKALNNVSGNSTGIEALNGKNATYETVKLIASDSATGDYFGISVSLSGNNALVGASLEGNDRGLYQGGSVYYYKDLDNVNGNSTYESVKLLASDSVIGDKFGTSVSLSGDRFVIGTGSNAQVNGVAVGKAYSGDIRAFTTLDAGDGTPLATDGLSFVSQSDWVIGATTSNNIVTLSRALNIATVDTDDYVSDTADVTALGKAVYIGQTAGANNNFLIIEGTLTANAVHVGTAGNSDNALIISRTGLVTAGELVVAASNVIVFDLGASGVNGLIDASSITFGGTLQLSAGDGFAAVKGATYKLFNLVTGDSKFINIESSMDVALAAAGLKWDFSALYTDGTISLVAVPASIDSFAVSNPSAPTATISADPQTGNAPLDTKLTWSAGNAASVTVSGPGVSSTDVSGTRPLTGLTQGTHTYTVMAQPKTTATISWSTSDASTLTLVTPSGDVTVTGQTSYTATVAGSYMLKAANAFGDVISSNPVTVTLPSSKTASVTITVNEQLPTIPAVIDNDTVIVVADPTTPGGIIINADILANPSDPDQSQVFEEDKITLFTATDILDETDWVVADPSTWTVVVSDGGSSITLVVAPTADTARFYRVATTLQPVQTSGTPEAGDTVKYNTVLFGQYKVTVPAKIRMFVANQLVNNKTSVSGLFDALPRGSSVEVAVNGELVTASRHAITNAWSANIQTLNVAVGEAANVYNAGSSSITIEVVGVVPLSKTYSVTAGQGQYVSSMIPVALSSPEDMGYQRYRNDKITTCENNEYVVYNVHALTGNWTSGAPGFGLGEGMRLTLAHSVTWTWEILVNPDSLILSK